MSYIMTYTYCCVYSAGLLMMDRETVWNIKFYSKNKFEKLVHLVGFNYRHIRTLCVCIVELHVAVNNIKILSVAQKWFYDEFMSPATMKRTQFFMCFTRHVCPILTKSGLCQRIFIKVPNIRFHGNPVWVELIHADRWTDRQKDWLTRRS